MPKLIDHDLRREEFAEATWRVVRRDGIAGTSIRTVAKEAGHSTGSLRHLFASKDDLIVAALTVIDRRLTERIEACRDEKDPRRLVQRVVAELWPLDAARRAEAEVYNALVAQAPANERLTRERDVTHNQLQEIGRQLIGYLAEQGLVADGVDLDRLALALNALIDGLAIDLLIHPQHEDLAFAVLEDFLDSLAPAAPSAS